MSRAMTRRPTPEKGAHVESQHGRTTRSSASWRHKMTGFTLALLIGVPSLAGLGGAASAGAAATVAKKPTKAQIARTCTQVADALADGPDPDVDPVGHALAQILPLRAIKTSDAPLKRDISTLAAAYAGFVKENGSRSAGRAVNVAGKAVDTICPGAF